MADLKTTLPWPTGKDYEKLKHSDSARMALQIAVRNKRVLFSPSLSINIPL